MTSDRRCAEAGFTLIETLVALTVLATSAVALIGATQAHLSRIAGLEQRAAAQWVAENALAEATLGIEVTKPPAMLGYDFTIRADRSATSDAAVEKLVLSVDAAEGVTMARVTGFVLTPAAERTATP